MVALRLQRLTTTAPATPTIGDLASQSAGVRGITAAGVGIAPGITSAARLESRRLGSCAAQFFIGSASRAVVQGLPPRLTAKFLLPPILKGKPQPDDPEVFTFSSVLMRPMSRRKR